MSILRMLAFSVRLLPPNSAEAHYYLLEGSFAIAEVKLGPERDPVFQNMVDRQAALSSVRLI